MGRYEPGESFGPIRAVLIALLVLQALTAAAELRNGDEDEEAPENANA